MIRSVVGSRRYGWWQFVINSALRNTEGFHSGYGKGLRRVIRDEGDAAAYHAAERYKVQRYDKLQKDREAIWASFVGNGGNAFAVHPILWGQSRTGEVNAYDNTTKSPYNRHYQCSS